MYFVLSHPIVFFVLFVLILFVQQDCCRTLFAGGDILLFVWLRLRRAVFAAKQWDGSRPIVL
jgi:hypothetical protein